EWIAPAEHARSLEHLNLRGRAWVGSESNIVVVDHADARVELKGQRRPLSASGRATLAQSTVKVEDVRLKLGESELHASGQLGPGEHVARRPLNVVLKKAIIAEPELQLLSQSAHGTISLKGEARGTLKHDEVHLRASLPKGRVVAKVVVSAGERAVKLS